MRTNQLSIDQRGRRLSLQPDLPRRKERLFERKGFGLGVAVTMQADAHEPALGSYGWDGLYGSDWTNDPQTQLIRVFFTQVLWGSVLLEVGKDYARLAYEAEGL